MRDAPLGARRKGRLHIRWNGRVKGLRLAPGSCQITMRSLAAGSVTDLSEAARIRVR